MDAAGDYRRQHYHHTECWHNTGLSVGRRMSSNSVAFSVPGEPVPWHTFQRQDNNPRSPANARKIKFDHQKDQIRLAARQAMAGREPHDGPVQLVAVFYRGISDRAPVREKPRQKWIDQHKLKRPDITNYLKLAEDALNGIVYLDDSQVLMASASKDYSEEPSTELFALFL